MRVAVFGGTGKTGWLAVRYAVDKGYGCKVLTRNPERMPSVPGVEFVEGNAVNGGKVMLTLTGCDAVVIALRPGKKAPESLLGKAGSHIVSGMRKLEIHRLVLLSSAAVSGTGYRLPAASKLSLSAFKRKHLEDLAAMERVIIESSLEWTVLRPGKLTEDRETGSYALGTEPGASVGPVDRGDLALCAVEEIEGGKYIRQSPYVTAPY